MLKLQNLWKLLILLFAINLITGNNTLAATSEEIDASVKAVLERFKHEVDPSGEIRKAAKGILVIPKVFKAGFVVGGEYGEGAFLIGKKNRRLLQCCLCFFWLAIRRAKEGYHHHILAGKIFKGFQEKPGMESRCGWLGGDH